MITLIVPFYNEAEHLRRSIGSILRQTYQDFEVLLIDDLSTDGSYALACELVSSDARFRLLRNTQKGLFHARNLALSEARGEFVCFLDSDDELLPAYLADLYADSLRHSSDLVVQGFTHVVSGRRDRMSVRTPGLYDVITDTEALFASFDVVGMGNVFGKLYRLSTIQEYHLQFSPHVLLSEDMFFVVSYLVHCRHIYLSSVDNYLYIAHRTSMSTFYWDFPTEERSYRALKNAWEQLLSSRPCPSLLSAYGMFTGNYVNRLIYTNLTHPRRAIHQQDNFRRLSSDYIPEYGEHYHPYTLFTRSLKWAATHHFYSFYRCLMNVAHLRYHLIVNYK